MAKYRNSKGGMKRSVPVKGTSPKVTDSGGSFGRAGNVKYAQGEQGRVKPNPNLKDASSRKTNP